MSCVERFGSCYERFLRCLELAQGRSELPMLVLKSYKAFKAFKLVGPVEVLAKLMSKIDAYNRPENKSETTNNDQMYIEPRGLQYQR